MKYNILKGVLILCLLAFMVFFAISFAEWREDNPNIDPETRKMFEMMDR